MSEHVESCSLERYELSWIDVYSCLLIPADVWWKWMNVLKWYRHDVVGGHSTRYITSHISFSWENIVIFSFAVRRSSYWFSYRPSDCFQLWLYDVFRRYNHRCQVLTGELVLIYMSCSGLRACTPFVPAGRGGIRESSTDAYWRIPWTETITGNCQRDN